MLLAVSSAAAILPLASLPARAEDPPQQLFGDWGGFRTDLANKGIQFQLGYVEEIAGNTSGGDQHLTRAAGQLTLGTTLDMQKLFGLQGGTFQMTVTDRNGNNLSADANLNTLMQVQEVFGRGNIFRLTQMWYEQKLFDDAVSVKFGRMGVGEDFSEFSCTFMNLTFCGGPPGNVAYESNYYWPLTQWATRIKFNAGDFYAMVGAYQVDPRNADETNGFYLGWSDTTGVLLPAEVGWKPTFGGLPGKYALTVWYDTSSADDVLSNKRGLPLAVFGGEPRVDRGRYGIGFIAQQQLTAPDSKDSLRGLSAFFTGTQQTQSSTFLDNQFTVGMLYTGLFESRPRDVIAVALGRTQVNPRYAENYALTNFESLGYLQTPKAEYEIEAYYNIHVYNGLDVRPNIQFIRYPGGITNADNVFVLGLKTEVNF